MTEYLVELYLPNARTAGVGILARARRGAEQLTAEGIRVRFLRSILVPQDETCFCLYEAASPDAVGEAARRAGLEFERIVEAVQVPVEVAECCIRESGTGRPRQAMAVSDGGQRAPEDAYPL